LLLLGASRLALRRFTKFSISTTPAPQNSALHRRRIPARKLCENLIDPYSSRGGALSQILWGISRPTPWLLALYLQGLSERLAVKKIAWCLWLVLLMPSMALSFERRDGAYYCTSKFAGGIAYNNALKQWEGSTFKPIGNFLLKLSYRETTKYSSPSVVFEYRDEYDVTITDEGDTITTSCLGLDGKQPSIDQFAFMRCSRANGAYEYKFNFDNNRFIQIYTAGYTNGADNNNDTPLVSGGLCTKVQ
jgi:hypothetical protein